MIYEAVTGIRLEGTGYDWPAMPMHPVCGGKSLAEVYARMRGRKAQVQELFGLTDGDGDDGQKYSVYLTVETFDPVHGWYWVLGGPIVTLGRFGSWDAAWAFSCELDRWEESQAEEA